MGWATIAHVLDSDDGQVLRGKRLPQTKLTPNDVRAIRRAWREGELQRVIAERFGISQQTVSKIVNRVWQRHVAGG
jgi:DNA-binding MarR family transcriptional regulator